MKNKKRKQERHALLAQDDAENRIREEQRKRRQRHVDRTKVLLGEAGDVASDSEDEFEEGYQGQFGTVVEKGALFKPAKKGVDPEHTGINKKEKRSSLPVAEWWLDFGT